MRVRVRVICTSCILAKLLCNFLSKFRRPEVFGENLENQGFRQKRPHTYVWPIRTCARTHAGPPPATGGICPWGHGVRPGKKPAFFGGGKLGFPGKISDFWPKNQRFFPENRRFWPKIFDFRRCLLCRLHGSERQRFAGVNSFEFRGEPYGGGCVKQPHCGVDAIESYIRSVRSCVGAALQHVKTAFFREKPRFFGGFSDENREKIGDFSLAQ